MKDFAKKVLDLISVHHVDYADVRVVDQKVEYLVVRNGKVEAVTSSTGLGFGVRTLVDGAWGFACSWRLEEDEAEKVVRQAVETARASGLAARHKVTYPHEPAIVDSFRTTAEKEPFAVPLDKKIEILLAADETMRKEQAVKVTRANMAFFRTEKVFANTEGSLIDQVVIESGGGIAATAVREGEVQIRSYPSALDGSYRAAGFEFVEELDLVSHAPRIAEEAARLLTAETCPSGNMTIILDSNQLVLQVHESVGHPVELDRVLGTEASYAGTSFVTTEKLDTFRYGSDIVNITADATVPGGLGTFGYDDEGIKGQRVPIVKDGIFVGYLSSRETAPVIGRTSSGAMRADGWNRIPLIRMTNINLEPGEWTFEDLIADTDDGIYFCTNKSWSIDDKRINFQFGTEIAYRIRNGKLGEIYKNPTYTGITPEFWQSCDAVCNRDHWYLWGLSNCGKGEPGQSMHVGHATAPARFRNVRVGVVS